MATLTIRHLDETTHARLRQRAASHGRSVEAEVRAILDATTARSDANILVAIHGAFGAGGCVDLELSERVDTARGVDLS